MRKDGSAGLTLLLVFCDFWDEEILRTLAEENDFCLGMRPEPFENSATSTEMGLLFGENIQFRLGLFWYLQSTTNNKNAPAFCDRSLQQSISLVLVANILSAF